MHIDDFTGRGASVQSLCEAFVSGAPPHAALLLGPAGIGKRTIAHTLAQGLFCTGASPRPCGTCPACKRYLAGSHSDVHRVAEAKRIGVEEVRDLIAALQAAPYEGGWRVAIIESAGAMTPQAQNSLLKTLEEPPQRTVFLLTALSMSQLLPTILSRCRIVQVPPMRPDAVTELLLARGVSPERATALAALSQGSLGDALQMDEDAAFWALRDKIDQTMASVHRPGDAPGAIAALRDDKAEASRICDLMEATLRDALLSSLGIHNREASAWQRQLSTASPRTLTKYLEMVTSMRRMLASNVSWQAVIERFILDYAEEASEWQL